MSADVQTGTMGGVKRLADYQVDVVAAPWYREPGPTPCNLCGLYHGVATVTTVEKARRIGLSEAAAIRCIFMALGRIAQADGSLSERRGVLVIPGTDVPAPAMSGIVISKEHAGAREVIAKIAANVRELAQAGDVECQRAIPYISATKIFFPTRGTTIRALASQGSTIRGWTGFVVLDEFAFVRNQEDVWGAAKPVANPNLGNCRGNPVLVISTPWAEGTLAHRLFTDPAMGFNQMSIDIYRAEAAGFPIDVQAAFREIGIPELIATEYLCQWGKGGGAFFPLGKLMECKRDDGREVAAKGPRGPGGEQLYETVEECGLPRGWERAQAFYGIDVGMGVGRDFTACVQYRIINDEYWVTGVRAFNDLPYDDQIDRLVPWIRRAPGEVLIDAGAGGDFLRQGLERRMRDVPGVSVTGVHLDSKKQEALAIRFRRLLDNDQLRIYMGTAAGGDPEGHHALTLELSSIKAKRGSSGRLQLETPRDEYRGHCDRAWGALIAMGGRVGGAVVRQSSGDARPSPPVILDIEHAGIFGG